VRSNWFSSSSAAAERVANREQLFFQSESGFSMKSKHPAWLARTAVSIVPWPEIMMTAGGPRGRLQAAQCFEPVHSRKPDVKEHDFHTPHWRDPRPPRRNRRLSTW